MLDFTQDIREAGLIFEDRGYSIVGSPLAFGKVVHGTGPNKFTAHLKPFSASYLNNKMILSLNNFLSQTTVLDVDDYELTKTIFNKLGLNLDSLVSSTMSWYGQPNRRKLIYNGINIPLDICSVRYNYKTVFEFKGATLPGVPGPENVYTYYDLAPPTIHSKTKQPYTFITKLFYKNELPEFPNTLLNIWKNWEQEKDNLLKLF
jgi:hypothetical protein